MPQTRHISHAHVRDPFYRMFIRQILFHLLFAVILKLLNLSLTVTVLMSWQKVNIGASDLTPKSSFMIVSTTFRLKSTRKSHQCVVNPRGVVGETRGTIAPTLFWNGEWRPPSWLCGNIVLALLSSFFVHFSAKRNPDHDGNKSHLRFDWALPHLPCFRTTPHWINLETQKHTHSLYLD